jgi:hypothetical protein
MPRMAAIINAMPVAVNGVIESEIPAAKRPMPIAPTYMIPKTIANILTIRNGAHFRSILDYRLLYE